MTECGKHTFCNFDHQPRRREPRSEERSQKEVDRQMKNTERDYKPELEWSRLMIPVENHMVRPMQIRWVVCPVCGGTGEVEEDEKKVECPASCWRNDGYVKEEY